MEKKENIITLENYGTVKIARIYKRFLAFLIDVILCIFYTLYIYFSLKEMKHYFSLGVFDLGTFYILYLYTFWTYLIFCYYFFRGRTVGKLVFKQRIISEDKKSLNIKQCFFRSGMIVFCCFMGLIRFNLYTVLFHYIFIVGGSLLYFLNKEPYKSKGKTLWDISTRTIVIEE